MDEIELKFLDIHVAEITQKIENIGAIKKYDAITEAYYFVADGFSGGSSDKKFLRLRKINNDVFITYKDPAKKSMMSVREETEIQVNNFDQALVLIEKLGFKRGYLTKKRRVHYETETAHFELDTQMGVDIPTYLEIETHTEQDMHNICKKLDIDIKKGVSGSIDEIFPEKFAHIEMFQDDKSTESDIH